MSTSDDDGAGLHRIVVVGGGLELATQFGDTLGKKGLAHVTLIKKARTHYWKPHLHEHATDCLAQSHWHGFRYRPRVGEMVGLDRDKREVIVAPDAPAQAERFRRRLVNACLRAHMQGEPLAPRTGSRAACTCRCARCTRWHCTACGAPRSAR